MLLWSYISVCIQNPSSETVIYEINKPEELVHKTSPVYADFLNRESI